MSTVPRTPPTREQLDRYASRFNQSLTLKHFGMQIAFPDSETVIVTVDAVQPAQRGGLGSAAVNGGVLAAIFDLAIGCTPALVDPTRRTATVQLSISFMRAVRGDRLTARGRVARAGDTLLFSEAVIFDEQGTACAKCDGLVRMSTERWEDGGSPAVN